MIDEELVWQRREITGTTVHVCENCGRPISDDLLRHVTDTATAANGLGMRICPDCLEAIERGTEPVELEDGDEQEYVR